MEKDTHKLLIAGDIMPTQNNIASFSSGNVEEIFDDKILELFREADYSIANLEGAITDNNISQQKAGPVIKAPTATMKGLKRLGLSACALANNHITDAGHQGAKDTLDALKDAGIDYVGLGTEGDMKTHLTLRLGAYKVCVYNVSEQFFNAPTDATLGAHLYDEYLVCNEVKALKATHDFVVVIYHGGSEYFQYPTPVVSKRCHRMIDCGADLITTQHTHCIGAEEHYKDGYILHGQGNFCFGNHKNAERRKITDRGLVLMISVADGRLAVEKHAVSLQDNRNLKYDDQDLTDFEARSAAVQEGKDFSAELTQCKLKELGVKYIGAYKGDSKPVVMYYKVLRKLSKRLFGKEIYNYSTRQLLLMQSTHQNDRRNEEMNLILKHLLSKKN